MKPQLLASVAALTATPSLAQTFDPTYVHMWWDNGWMMGTRMLVMLLILVLAAVGVASLLRGFVGPGPGASIEILKTRYARGEISKEEYEERSRIVAE